MASGEPPPATTNGLVVPVVIWGQKPPDNRITVVRYLSDRTTIVTGASSGHVITWKCDEEALTPYQLMIGHDAPITAISPTNNMPSSTRFITASSDGHLCLWDVQDGRCVDSVSSLFIHRYMQPYTYKSSRHTRSTRLFCIGDYSDIVVLDPQDLTVVFQLSSRVEPDWVCCYDVVQRTNKSEQCIGISMAGMIKVWSLVELEKKDLATPLYEDESKRLELKDVKSISFNPVNERLLLVVCSATWQLVDLDDLSIIIVHNCPARAINGKILDVDKLAVTFVDQTLRVYQLPLEKLEGAQARQRFGATPRNYMGISDPFEFAIWEGSKSNLRSWLNDVTFTFASQRSDQSIFQAARATRAGHLLIWRIPRFDEKVYEKFTSPTQFPLKYRGSYEETLSSVWMNLNSKQESSMGVLDFGEITCSLFVSGQGKLIIGRSDGLIVMTYACETLARQLLNVTLEKPAIRRLDGHKGAVSNLFYPHEHHPRYDPEVLISGADDFAVIVWNISTAERLHRFVVHGGPILRFLVPPSNTSKQVSKCICAIASDHSVSLLNIRDMKCVLFASRHPYPVNLVKWRPLDDFMLVRLEDGSVFVWQMETACLDRVVAGVVAEEFLAACDEQIGKEEGTDQIAAPHAIVLMRTLRYKGMDMVMHHSPPIVGAPLSPIADACRTARHALTLIATARPTALLSALSMEVARYNSAAQHQTIQHTVVSPLLKSRTEVLRIIEELSEKRYAEVVEMMLPVGDVLVHCLDTSLLKQKTLSEIFPPITKFYMVAYCSSTRRIAFGGKNGTCVVHELRAAKAHNLQAHQGPVSAVAFSEDGKYLATYGDQDAKINFWQTSQTFLGMGQNQMKLVKSQPAPSLAAFSPNGTISTFRPKLVWINPKSLTLMMPEGREQRFTI
ncbi:WD domain, G-beta repeat protein [Ostertagia ostertagi]